MSGILNVILANGSETTIIVTVGNIGNSYGYGASSFGSINPTTVKGHTINGFQHADTGDSFFIFSLSGIVAQNFIYQLRIQKNDGSFQTYSTASANQYTTGSGVTTWVWTGLGSHGGPWTAPDVGNARAVFIS